MVNDQSMRKILYVVNPLSGTRKEDILQALKNYHTHHSKDEVKYLFPEWKKIKEQLDDLLTSFPFDTIVACGGDGTIRTLAEYIYGRDIKLGIIPLGSSNGLAKNLNLPLDIESNLDIIHKSSHVKPVSSIRVNDYFSIHLADAGINAKIVKVFEKSGVRGIWGYIKAGLRVLRDFDYFKVNIHDKKSSWSYNSCMVVLANANMYGTGFVINHLGDMSDQLFEIIVIKRISLKGFLKMALNNWIPDPNLIHVLQSDYIELESSTPLNLQVDGEYLGKMKKITAQINPLTIDIIIP